MRLFNSLAFKNALLYLLIFLIGLGTIGYLLLNNSSKRIIQTAENQLKHNGELIEIQLKVYTSGLLSQMDYLVNSPVLLAFLNDKNERNYNLLAQNYLSLIKSNDDFSQIRFISVPEGKEIVRADRNEGKPEIVLKDKLQNKRDRNYYQEASKLGPDDIYFSPINLNREFGKISEPKTPTLRVARPVFHDGHIIGVIVINTDLTKLFTRLKNSVDDNFTLRMVNANGFYLMHEIVDSTFVFEFNNPPSQFELATTTQENQQNIQSKTELMSIHKVRIEGMKYDFIFLVIANRSLLLSSYYEWRKQSLLLILLTGIIFSLLAFTILRRQSKYLATLTDNMRQFPNKLQLADLPTNRKDEIGTLAKAFEEMAEIINTQIKSILSETHKAESAEREKSEFIENISHEIRNPLQSIVGLSKILEQNNPNPNQIDILKSIKLNTSNLLGLVNNILDYQNVINGNYITELHWTSIDNLIQEITVGNLYASTQKSIQTTYHTDESLAGLEVKIDRLRISQILNNLLTNAMTHTPSNGKISVHAAHIETNGQFIKIAYSVADDGVGISREAILRITERYFSNKKDTIQTTNFGIGLTIVNELLAHLGSELKVSSQKDVGSTFYFEITSEYRLKNIEDIDTPSHHSMDNLKVLVIDDDPQILDLYQHIFADNEATLIQSFDDLEGDEQTKYDLIISDYRLSRSLITEHLEMLQNLATEHACLIIVSGANLDLSDIKQFFPEVKYIRKPFDNDQLAQMINEGLVISKYGNPQVDVIKKDYDHQKDKYENAIHLLINEWQVYNQRIIQSIQENNIPELEEILHKFNTTLRRLKVTKLENRLMELKTRMTNGKVNQTEEIAQIAHIMSVYLSILKSSLS